MKFKTKLHLTSSCAYGVGGPEAEMIDMIYSFLLEEYQQVYYRYIGIVQIGDELKEVIVPQKKEISIGINYPTFESFFEMDEGGKNRIRLDVVHTALVRIAEQEGTLDIKILEKIRGRILMQDFHFKFTYKTYKDKMLRFFQAKIIIEPGVNSFRYFAQFEQNDEIKCSVCIYTGLPTDHYFTSFFHFGKWVNDNQFVITGKEKEVEIRILVDKCMVEYINLTKYDAPPTFQLMLADEVSVDKVKAREDWLDSMSSETRRYFNS